MQTTNDARTNFDHVEPATGLARPQPRLRGNYSHAAAAESFQLLAQRLNRVRAKKAIQTVLITSPIPADGKSTVAWNLSGTLAENGHRTLLIDADLRVPQNRKLFALPVTSGLGAVLAGDANFEAALRRVDPQGLYYLPAGDCLLNPIPLLESALQNILQRAGQDFDWVIIDSPPLNPVADAHCIAYLVDAILLVVRWGFTPKKQLDHALAALKGLPFMGMVLNRFDDPQDSSYSSYYDQRQGRLLTAAASASDHNGSSDL